MRDKKSSKLYIVDVSARNVLTESLVFPTERGVCIFMGLCPAARYATG